jgi:hypothetical protein
MILPEHFAASGFFMIYGETSSTYTFFAYRLPIIVNEAQTEKEFAYPKSNTFGYYMLNGVDTIASPIAFL